MSKRQNCLNRLRAIEREFLAGRLAARRLKNAIEGDPTLLPPPLTPRDVHRLNSNLEATFLVRLFAEFEAGLREVWADWCQKKTAPRMEELLNSLAARCSISDGQRDHAHAVRKYRNALVHEGSEGATAVSMGDARKYLCTYFSFMPVDWRP